ncbi:MAG: hypothetical protein JWR77_1064 [Rhizorhabdus sp.]|nr:hypothetical protein [Rhizorhabdus sp.]
MWLAASSGAQGEASGSVFANRFFDATRSYAAELTAFSQTRDTRAPALPRMGILETGMSLALPASHQILLGHNLSRRDLLASTGLFGMAAAEYLCALGPCDRTKQRNPVLIVNRFDPNALDGVGALSLERTNFHERLVISPIRSRAALRR